MPPRNLELRGDAVFLNGEHVADLVPGPATSNRWMFRGLLKDVDHVAAHPYSVGHFPRHEGDAQ